MPYPFWYVAGLLWIAWVVSWHLAAFWRDPASARAPARSYHLPFAIAIVGFALAFGLVRWRPLWPVGDTLGWAMVALTAGGLALAWWARIHLGRLWHGGVSRTEGHRVVRGGPYAWVRHPIYTGLIAAVFAMAALRATPPSLAGAALFALGFVLKARVEERFLERELPDYADYRRRVGMIVPRPRRGAPPGGSRNP